MTPTQDIQRLVALAPYYLRARAEKIAEGLEALRPKVAGAVQAAASLPAGSYRANLAVEAATNLRAAFHGGVAALAALSRKDS